MIWHLFCQHISKQKALRKKCFCFWKCYRRSAPGPQAKRSGIRFAYPPEDRRRRRSLQFFQLLAFRFKLCYNKIGRWCRCEKNSYCYCIYYGLCSLFKSWNRMFVDCIIFYYVCFSRFRLGCVIISKIFCF